MLTAVFLGHLLAFVSEVFFKCRVDNEFLTNGVASQLPGELVAESLLKVVVPCIPNHFVVVLLELAVIFGYRIRNSGHGGWKGDVRVASGW